MNKENQLKFNQILNKIKEYNSIIILRHKQPDFDAYGSQLGLYYVLKENFKEKSIYLDGDDNYNNFFNEPMSNVSDEIYKNSLVIILDTGHDKLMYDEKYKLSKFIIVIDHHELDSTIGDLDIVRSNYSSASELVAEFIYSTNLRMNPKSADALYIGIIGDSNRFYYKGTSSNTFLIASKLVLDGADIIKDYKLISKEESNEEKKTKGYILSNYKVDGNVAYFIFDKKTRLEFNVNENFISRGCVNLLSGIKGIDAYIGFTEFDDGLIYVELRSKEKPIVDVAKRNGGGGHDLACGLRINSFNDVDKIVKEVKEELKK